MVDSKILGDESGNKFDPALVKGLSAPPKEVNADRKYSVHSDNSTAKKGLVEVTTAEVEELAATILKREDEYDVLLGKPCLNHVSPHADGWV